VERQVWELLNAASYNVGLYECALPVNACPICVTDVRHWRPESSSESRQSAGGKAERRGEAEKSGESPRQAERGGDRRREVETVQQTSAANREWENKVACVSVKSKRVSKHVCD